MATGERRLGSSARRGMTVLGKIPAVPKPINLPSQRLENRGLDPSVEIVPRGTFSWGTGRSPPASGSSWGNVGLSCSPPVSTGAWNSASSVQPVPGSNNITGTLAQTPPRPLSAGSTRPLSAGTTRPSSASQTSGRAWGGAAKLEEQLQPSRFNLTTVEFPTLGSEKNPNLRPQQNTASSNRPTSADATKERHVVYTETSFSRPTSADGSKERKSGYPGVAPSDRPTSADGTLVDRGRHQSDMRLRSFPAFADGNLSDQKQPNYAGVVGHGTAGPGPGTYGQLKDSHSPYPPLVQQGIASPGSHMLPVGEIMYPGVSQHDQYFNRHQALHSNMGEREVLVLPMDTRPGVYGSFPSDSGPNHVDRSRVYQSSHHPQSSWEPNNFDRSRVYQRHHLQSGPSEHLRHGMMHIEPQTYGMETAMQHEQPVIGNRRDGYNHTNKDSGEQRARWAGRNVVYTGCPVDAHETSISSSGTVRELQKPDIFITSWGHQPTQSTHPGWGNAHNADTSMGMYKGGTSSAMYKQAPLVEKMPQGSVFEGGLESRHIEEGQGMGAGHVGETPHPVSSQGSGHANQGDIQLDSLVFPLGASVTGKASKLTGSGVTEMSNSPRQVVKYLKQEETVRSLASKTLIGGPECLEMGKTALDNGNTGGGRDIWAPGSGASTTKQEEEVARAEQIREPQRTEFVSGVALQKQQDTHHENLEGKNNVHTVDKDSTIAGTSKSTTAKKKYPVSQRFSKGKKNDDVAPSPLHECEETTYASKITLSIASDGNRVNGSTSSSAVFSTSPSKERNANVSSGVPVTFDNTKQASEETCIGGALATVQAKSSTHAQFEHYSADDHKAIPTPKPTSSVTPLVETAAISSSEEGGQVPIDNGSNMKTRQNTHSSRRPHYTRSMHESNSADKQHVNHGMVWAPVKNSTTVGATKEENQPHVGKAGKIQESLQQISTEVNQVKPMQPLQELQPKESQGQRRAQQVQQMQSAASSQQGQGHQMQEHSVVSCEIQMQQMQHQKVDKRQGQRTQHQRPRSSSHKETEQWMQQEQFVAKNQSLGTKQHQSVVPSYLEQGQPQSHFASNSQREVHVKEILPAKDKHSESRPIPAADRFEGKKNKDESSRNQHQQRREQEYEQRTSASSHHGQRFVNRGDRIVVEDPANQPSESLTLPVIEPNNNKEEVRSHSLRTSKHQRRRQHESSASLIEGDRHRSMLEPSLAEPEATKNEEESRTYNRKLVRQQEMQNKQSAAVSHQELNQIGEEHNNLFMQTPDSTSCGSSTIKNERKFYVPKQARQQYTHQQECATSGYRGKKSQEQTSQEAQLSSEKVQHYAQSSQLSGVESNVTESSVESHARKNDIELYTPKPARQQHMQGHQSTSRSQRRQRVADLAEGQCGQDATSSSTQAGIESALNKDKDIIRHDRVSDSMGNKGITQSCVTGNSDESKLHVSSQFSQSQKEIKYYSSKPDRQQHLQQQQSVLNMDQAHVEVPLREGTLPQEKWERSHQMSGTEQSKRKDEIKLYKPRPRQQKSTEGKVVKETEELSLPEEREQQRSGNDERVGEFEHGYGNRNYSTRPHKSTSFPRSQMSTQPSVEDGTVDGRTLRVDDTSGEVISKEHSKKQEAGFHQKIGGFRQRYHDVGTLEEAEVFKPKQYQKRQYHYQPVAQQPQTVKPREEDFDVDHEQKFGLRQLDQGQNRYERREGLSRRGRRLDGYGYRAVDHSG